MGLASSSQHRPSVSDDDELELRRSKRARTIKDFGLDFYAYTLEDPNSFKEALLSLDADLWKEVINDEMDSLKSNGTWHLVDLSPDCKKIGCKWILKKRLNLMDLLRNTRLDLWPRVIDKGKM